MSSTKNVQTKRAYDKPSKDDGYRVLVDKMWPRGVSKHDLLIDEWIEDIAPSSELRKWFSHDPKKWEEFKKCYFDELKSKSHILQKLKSKIHECGKLTLVYSAKDTEHNNAKALKEFFESKT